jgi:hypothetical protein
MTIKDGWIEVLPARAAMVGSAFGPDADAARADYARLLQLNLGTFPELGEPVDTSDAGPLGPLWPNGDEPEVH